MEEKNKSLKFRKLEERGLNLTKEIARESLGCSMGVLARRGERVGVEMQT